MGERHEEEQSVTLGVLLESFKIKWPWTAGRGPDRGEGARVHEAGEEDVEEELDPGSNGRLRGRGRRGRRGRRSSRKKTTASSLIAPE